MAKIVEERFEGSSPTWVGGDEESWSDDFGLGCSQVLKPTEDLSYGAPPGWGGYCRRITYNTSGWEAQKTVNFNDITGVCYFNFEIVIGFENLANGEGQPVFRLINSTASETAIQINIFMDSGGVLRWKMFSQKAGPGGGVTGDEGPVILTNTVYKHQGMYDFNNGQLLWYVNGVLALGESITPDALINRVRIGLSTVHVQKTLIFDFDRVLVDDAAWPEFHTPHSESNRQLTIADAEVKQLIDSTAQVSIDAGLGGDPDVLSFILDDQENRVIQSKDLSDTNYWDRTNLSAVLEEDPFVSTPHEDSPVWQLVEDSNTSSHNLSQLDIPIKEGQIYTATVWCKLDEVIGGSPRNYRLLLNNQATGDAVGAEVDVTSFELRSSIADGDGVLHSARVTKMGSVSPYELKLELVFEFIGVNAVNVRWFNSMLNASFSGSYAGDGISALRLWNPQISRGGYQTVPFEILTGETPFYYGPSDLAEVTYKAYFKEADGAPWGWQTLFNGQVVGIAVSDVGWLDGRRVNRWSVECAGPAFELGLERFDIGIEEGSAGAALDDVIALVSGSGFTAKYDSAIGNIAGFTSIYASPVTMVEEIARRSGRLIRIHPDKEVELFVPGAYAVIPFINRDTAAAQLPGEQKADWKRDSRKLAGSVRVLGVNALVIASGGDYTDIDAPVFNASGVEDPTDLARIAASLLAGVQSPILNGTIASMSHSLIPGWSAIVSDLDWGVDEEEVYLRRVNMARQADGTWLSSLEVTTEELVDHLGIMSQDPGSAAPGASIPGIQDFHVYGAIPTPNAAAPACAAGEVRLHMRFNSASNKWRMELHTGTGVGGASAKYEMRMYFNHQGTLTVAH